MRFIIATAIAAMLATSATADTIPRPVPGADPRVRAVDLKDGMVVRLPGRIGRQTTLVFPRGVVLQDAFAGDGEAWAVQLGPDGLTAALKPAGEQFATNMSLVTNRGIIHLELTEAGPVIYELRFIKPKPPPPPPKLGRPMAAPRCQLEWTKGGSADLKPVAAWCDDRFTYLQFAPGQSIPGVTKTKGTEEMSVNWHQTGVPGQIAIQTIAPRLVLRAGQLVGCVWNRAMEPAK